MLPSMHAAFICGRGWLPVLPPLPTHPHPTPVPFSFLFLIFSPSFWRHGGLQLCSPALSIFRAQVKGVRLASAATKASRGSFRDRGGRGWDRGKALSIEKMRPCLYARLKMQVRSNLGGIFCPPPPPPHIPSLPPLSVMSQWSAVFLSLLVASRVVPQWAVQKVSLSLSSAARHGTLTRIAGIQALVLSWLSNGAIDSYRSHVRRCPSFSSPQACRSGADNGTRRPRNGGTDLHLPK